MTRDEQRRRRMAPVAEKFGITVEQALLLRTRMFIVWGIIGGDVEDGFRSCGYDPYGFGSLSSGGNGYDDEAAMIAESVLDADRLTYGLYGEKAKSWDWVYKLEDGSWRPDVIEMGEAIWRVR